MIISSVISGTEQLTLESIEIVKEWYDICFSDGKYVLQWNINS